MSIFDLSSPFHRVGFLLIGLMLIGFGVASVWHVGFVYRNWWKDLVFGPFAIAAGVLFIFAMFKLGSLERRERAKSHRFR